MLRYVFLRVRETDYQSVSRNSTRSRALARIGIHTMLHMLQLRCEFVSLIELILATQDLVYLWNLMSSIRLLSRLFA